MCFMAVWRNRSNSVFFFTSDVENINKSHLGVLRCLVLDVGETFVEPGLSTLAAKLDIFDLKNRKRVTGLIF